MLVGNSPILISIDPQLLHAPLIFHLSLQLAPFRPLSWFCSLNNCIRVGLNAYFIMDKYSVEFGKIHFLIWLNAILINSIRLCTSLPPLAGAGVRRLASRSAPLLTYLPPDSSRECKLKGLLLLWVTFCFKKHISGFTIPFHDIVRIFLRDPSLPGPSLHHKVNCYSTVAVNYYSANCQDLWVQMLPTRPARNMNCAL